MAKIEPKIFDELKTALVSFGDSFGDNSNHFVSPNVT